MSLSALTTLRQDLFASIFLGTVRIANNKHFHPGHDAPQLCLDAFSHTPRGFRRESSRLGETFMRLVSDAAALYHPEIQRLKSDSHEGGFEKLCNTQAKLEGQLHELRQSTSDDLAISCIIATFLCVYGFWTDIWNSALIPRELSKQILHHIHRWQESEDQCDAALLCWLVNIGKAFAIDPHVRRGLNEVKRSDGGAVADSIMNSDQATLLSNEFIWSDLFFQTGSGWFWERITETE